MFAVAYVRMSSAVFVVAYVHMSNTVLVVVNVRMSNAMFVVAYMRMSNAVLVTYVHISNAVLVVTYVCMSNAVLVVTYDVYMFRTDHVELAKLSRDLSLQRNDFFLCHQELIDWSTSSSHFFGNKPLLKHLKCSPSSMGQKSQLLSSGCKDLGCPQHLLQMCLFH